MSHEFNVAVLGGGPGGYEAAIRCAQLGLKTCLIEARELGGTCLNRGCIPTKALLHGAEVYESAKDGGVFGISGEVRLDYAKLAAFKDDRVSKLVRGIEALEKANGVEVIRGFGRVAGPNALTVGERTVTYDKLILAMGSAPAKPPVPGMESAYTHATTHELAEYPMMRAFLSEHERCMLFCIRILELPDVCARAFQNIPDLLFYTVQTELEAELSERFDMRLFLLQGGYFGSMEGVLALDRGMTPEAVHDALSHATRRIAERNGFRSMLAFSGPFHGEGELSQALTQTIRGINYASLTPDETVNVIRPENVGSELRYRISDEDRNRLLDLLLEGQTEPLLDGIEDILSRLQRERRLSLRSIDTLFIEVYNLFKEQLEARGLQDRLPEEYQIDELRVQLHHYILMPQQRRRLLAGVLGPGLAILQSSANQLIFRMKDYIDRHYSEKINLQTLSERFYISREYASRLFKREMRTTFINYLTETRLNRASQLLLQTDLSLTEIALQTGFKESAYLIRVFIKRYGITPTEYRRSRGRR